MHVPSSIAPRGKGRARHGGPMKRREKKNIASNKTLCKGREGSFARSVAAAGGVNGFL